MVAPCTLSSFSDAVLNLFRLGTSLYIGTCDLWSTRKFWFLNYSPSVLASVEGYSLEHEMELELEGI